MPRPRKPARSFPGKPVRAHWGTPDPAAVSGSPEAQRAAFRDALTQIRRRVQRFTSLPFESLDPGVLQRLFADIAVEHA